MNQTAHSVSRSLDARLARCLVRPLVGTWVTPNHLTTVRAVLGLAAAACLAMGSLALANIGAWLFVLSNLVDHTDGELARMSGQTSRWGHYYDLACDFLIHVLLFVGVGYGLRGGSLGNLGVWLGLLAGVAVAFTFWLHLHMESTMGKAGARLPDAGLFEIEDILYLLPLITIFDIRQPFILVSAVGAPAFAIWLWGYARRLRARHARDRAQARARPTAASYAGHETAAYRPAYLEQGEFIHIEQFLPTTMLQALLARLPALDAEVHRNFIPRHKKGGSVSRYQLNDTAPEIPALYADPDFVGWLQGLCGETLLPCPADDPHAYALYYYTEAGDHIGYHYDTSYYRGHRYTVLIGLVDDSSCKLDYQLHRDDPERDTQSGSISLRPGALVFFNGDAVYHRITPAHAGERRVSLTLEYVTDARMHPMRRFISNMKDAIAYFGFRQVFARKSA